MIRRKPFQSKAALLAAFAMFISLFVGASLTAGFADAAAATDATGWVWASHPTVESYAPPGSYSYNSEGSTNRIERRGPGEYKVIFTDLRRADFEAQVVAYGTGNVFCNIDGNVNDGTGGSGDDRHLYVICLDNVELQPTDSRFVASITGQDATGDGDGSSGLQGAGVHFGHNDGWSGWNSSGGGFEITTLDVGVYNVRIEDQTAKGANIQITAVGGGPFGKWCNVSTWWQLGSDTMVRVNCWSVQWPTLARFHLRFSVQQAGNLAYAWSDRPTTSSYSPAHGHQWQGPSGSTSGAVASSSGVGSYAIRFPDLSGFPSTAMVTPYSAGLTRCAISSWSSSAMAVNVRCIDAETNQATSSRFLTWARAGSQSAPGPVVTFPQPTDPGPIQTIPRGPGTINTIPPYPLPSPGFPPRG